jgi:hypothetical protein
VGQCLNQQNTPPQQDEGSGESRQSSCECDGDKGALKVSHRRTRTINVTT